MLFGDSEAPRAGARSSTPRRSSTTTSVLLRSIIVLKSLLMSVTVPNKRRARSASPKKGELDAKKARHQGVSSPTAAGPDVNEVTTQRTTTDAAKIMTSLKTPNNAANASDSDTNTPSGTPTAVDAVHVAALPPDVRQMLEMIDEKKTISKETESIEVKELTRFIDDLELCRTRLCSDTEDRWPPMGELKSLLGRFFMLRLSNAQSKVGQDFFKALQSTNIQDIRYHLKTVSDYAKATRTGLLTDSPQKRGHSMISDRQRQALKNWRWIPQENGFESFDVMTAQEGHTVLSALIAAKEKQRANLIVIEDSAA